MWEQTTTIERRRPGLANGLRRSAYPWLRPRRSLLPLVLGTWIGLCSVMTHSLNTCWSDKTISGDSFDAIPSRTLIPSVLESKGSTWP